MFRHVLAIVCLTLPASLALAQSEPPQGPPPQGRRGAALGGMRDMGGPSLERRVKRVASQLTQELSLTDEQQEQLDDLVTGFLEDHKDAQRPNPEQMREVMEQIREARQAGDDAKVEELRKQLGPVGNQAIAEFLGEVEPILTPEQKSKLDDIRDRLLRPARGPTDPLERITELRDELNLEPKQAKKFDSYYDKLSKDIQSSKMETSDMLGLVDELRKAAEEGDQDKVNQIREKLRASQDTGQAAVDEFFISLGNELDPEQLKIMDRCRDQLQRGGPGGDDPRRLFQYAMRCDLSAEQKKELADMQREFAPQIREARRDQKALTELSEQIETGIKEILTPDQLTQFEELKAKAAERPQNRRDRRVRQPGERGNRPPAEPQTPDEEP